MLVFGTELLLLHDGLRRAVFCAASWNCKSAMRLRSAATQSAACGCGPLTPHWRHMVIGIASPRKWSESMLLGFAMAHELGHLPQGSPAHAQDGLMVAKWNATDLDHAASGLLQFSPAEAAWMRAEAIPAAPTAIDRSKTVNARFCLVPAPCSDGVWETLPAPPGGWSGNRTEVRLHSVAPDHSPCSRSSARSIGDLSTTDSGSGLPALSKQAIAATRADVEVVPPDERAVDSGRDYCQRFIGTG